jgi:predicted secreted protein
VEVDVKALTPAPFTVTLHYARSWEKDKAPLHTLKCTFNQADTAAAATGKKADGKNLPHLKERFYRLANLADAYQVTLRRGRDVDFDLEEQPAAGKLWKVTSFDKSKVRLELDHDRADDPGEVDNAEVEIKAVAPGESTVVLVYGDNEKTVTVRVNAR